MTVIVRYMNEATAEHGSAAISVVSLYAQCSLFFGKGIPEQMGGNTASCVCRVGCRAIECRVPIESLQASETSASVVRRSRQDTASHA